MSRRSPPEGYGPEMDLGDVPTWSGAVIAAVSAVVAWYSQRKSHSAETAAENYKREALSAATKAAAAEARAAEAADRSADAFEQFNTRVQARDQAAAAAPWSVAHHSGAIYVLSNDSDYPKYQVAITGSGVSKRRVPDSVDVLDPRSSTTFWSDTSNRAGNQINVTWSDTPESGEARTWTGTMPPR